MIALIIIITSIGPLGRGLYDCCLIIIIYAHVTIINNLLSYLLNKRTKKTLVVKV